MGPPWPSAVGVDGVDMFGSMVGLIKLVKHNLDLWVRIDYLVNDRSVTTDGETQNNEIPYWEL